MISRDSTSSIAALKQRLSKCFTPPMRITCSQFTLKFRKMPVTSAAGGGNFTFTNAPWQEEPLDAPEAPGVIGVVLMWASQVTGKTETIVNRCIYKIKISPGSMLMVQPTLEMAEDWSKNRFAVTLADTPCMRGLVKDPRSRDSGNKILYKKYPGGFIAMAGANSPASLAGRPIRDVIFDEVDRYPESAGTEGDPISLGETRTESYSDSVSFKTSTPTIRGRSRIEKEFEDSDKRYWFVECPHCQHEQTLKWKNVRFSWVKADGTEERDPSRACIVCENESCRREWTEDERQTAIRAGKWKPTAPFSGVRGYHINALYCLFRPKKAFKTRLHQTVKGFLKATEKGKEALKAWTNTVLAETWAESSETPADPNDLLGRRENYTIPEKCFLLICKVDVHANRLEGEIEGFGFGDESWGIEYFDLFGSPFKPEVWKALDEKINQQFDHPSGQKMRVAITGIDMGGNVDKKSWAVAVYKYVRSHTQASRGRGGVIALKGSSSMGAPLANERLQKNGINLLMVGTDAAKSAVYDRLKILEPGPRYYHFPMSYNAEYFKGLVAEAIHTTERRGFTLRQWHKIHARNEPLDLKAYGLALLELLNPDMRAIAARFKMPTHTGPAKEYVLKPDAPTAPKPTNQPPRPQMRLRKRLPFRGRRI